MRHRGAPKQYRPTYEKPHVTSMLSAFLVVALKVSGEVVFWLGPSSSATSAKDSAASAFQPEILPQRTQSLSQRSQRLVGRWRVDTSSLDGSRCIHEVWNNRKAKGTCPGVNFTPLDFVYCGCKQS